MSDSEKVDEYIEKIEKLNPDLTITSERVQRMRREVVEDSPYILEEKVASLSFPTSELRALIADAMASGCARRECDAQTTYRHDRSDDFKGEFETYADHEGQTKVRLSLEIDRGCPVFTMGGW